MSSVKSEPKPDPEAAVKGPEAAVHGEPEQRVALYDRFAERVREIFDAGQEKSKEAMEKAMESAREQLAAAGEFSAEQGEVFKQFMRRDLEQTALDMRALGHEAKERLHPARLGAGALSSMARLLEAAGSALQNLSRKAESALRYTTGDITTAGTLTCVQCGQAVQLKRTSTIPPCPKCHGSEFRKGY
jgi:isocitrate dehydrogenase